MDATTSCELICCFFYQREDLEICLWKCRDGDILETSQSVPMWGSEGGPSMEGTRNVHALASSKLSKVPRCPEVFLNLAGGFKYFLCSPLFGEDSQFY